MNLLAAVQEAFTMSFARRRIRAVVFFLFFFLFVRLVHLTPYTVYNTFITKWRRIRETECYSN